MLSPRVPDLHFLFNALRRIGEDVDQSPERDQIIDFIKGHDMKLAAIPYVDLED